MEAAPPLPQPLDLRQLRARSVLGRGAKGVVFLVRDSASGRSFALKAVDRSAAERKAADGYRRIWFERDVLGSLKHPFLPELRGVVSTDRIFGFVMDWFPGGDLNALRRRQTEKMFSDDVIRFYAAELVLALEHLHSQGIVYRDLKPENVLIQGSGHIVLVDFDLSTRLPTRTPATSPNQSIDSPCPLRSPHPTRRASLRSCFACKSDVVTEEDSGTSSSDTDSASTGKSNSFVGTEEYVSPEVIQGRGHDFAVDWWSLGVVLYEMLYGRTPFRGQNRKETFYYILSKPPELVGEKTPLRDLIGRLLEKDPQQRISGEGVKAHEFFHGLSWDAILDISRPPYVPPPPAPEEAQGPEGGEEDYVDVEKFVGGMFGAGAGKDGGDKEAAGDCEKDDHHWVRRLSNECSPKADEFSAF